MNMIRTSILAAASLLVLGTSAWALTPNPACVRDARDEFVLCKAACRESFQVDKDMCRNVDHDCAEAARAGRQACVSGPLEDLRECKDDCNATLAGERQKCRTDHPPDTDPTGFDTCVDAAQVVAFQCKDGCREGVAGELKLCRKTFRATLKACPPATP